ncbi:hypothetical protein N7490_000205 [Penicillium lividum]|nr:hypothetical protein N7490_000205 [Penicillium lividum]
MAPSGLLVKGISSSWDNEPEHLTSRDFDIPEVHYAINPHPVWGWAHGPIPNPAQEQIPVTKPIPVKVEYVATYRTEPEGVIRALVRKKVVPDKLHRRDPIPPIQLNTYNNVICDVIINKAGTMCGRKFDFTRELKTHLHRDHRGSFTSGSNDVKSEWNVYVNALKKWVLHHGWRNANYAIEPVRMHPDSLIDQFCETLDHIARYDKSFARRFGYHFHRHAAYLSSMDDPEWGHPAQNHRFRADDIYKGDWYSEDTDLTDQSDV